MSIKESKLRNIIREELLRKNSGEQKVIKEFWGSKKSEDYLKKISNSKPVLRHSGSPEYPLVKKLVELINSSESDSELKAAFEDPAVEGLYNQDGEMKLSDESHKAIDTAEAEKKEQLGSL